MAVIQAAVQETVGTMGAEVAHRDCVVPEQFVLNRGTVVLDPWRLQIGDRSEDVKWRCGLGIRAKRLNWCARIRAARLWSKADPVWRTGIDCGIPAGIRPIGLKQASETRLTISISVEDARRTGVPICGNRKHT